MDNTKNEQLNSVGQLAMQGPRMLADMIALTATEFNAIVKFDKSGKPYILHCLKVMHYLEPYGYTIQTIGCGHDLFEDTKVTRSRLLQLAYPDRVVNGIQALTKMPGQSYEEYKQTVFSNDDAVLVKMADIRHNSDLRRLKGVRQKDFDRHVEYMEFYYQLEQVAMERGLMRVRSE
jgi:(p)ppGpp synthase/HD superfamily hydrolase